MRRIAWILALAALAGCGADGEPVQPSVSAGVTVSNSGVYPSATLGLSRGPLTVGLGVF